jgi:hypothetical protein
MVLPKRMPLHLGLLWLTLNLALIIQCLSQKTFFFSILHTPGVRVFHVEDNCSRGYRSGFILRVYGYLCTLQTFLGDNVKQDSSKNRRKEEIF